MLQTRILVVLMMIAALLVFGGIARTLIAKRNPVCATAFSC